MLVTLIPLFDENMAVKAYSVYPQKQNPFTNPLSMSTGSNDGAGSVQGLDVIRAMGLNTLSSDCEIFVPVSNVSIFSDLAEQTGHEPHERIVILIDRTCPPVEMYVNRVKELKALGYKMAIRKVAVLELADYGPLLQYMDYVFLNNKKIDISKGRIFFEKLYPHIKLIASNIESQELFEELKSGGGYQYYEGEFYRVPLTKGAKEIAPVKLTYLELLKVVNAPDFELSEAADVIGRDPALAISLLKMVNRVVKTAEITTIRHAAAMLGQRELKRWINTAVSEQLYSDKPSEVTRLSLLRARFAENLAGVFGLKMREEELFLMGLFSVLDVILDKPMKEAIEMIQISGDAKEALVNHTGALAPVLDFVMQYEKAHWEEVSRLMIVNGYDMKAVEDAYKESLIWYRMTIIG